MVVRTVWEGPDGEDTRYHTVHCTQCPEEYPHRVWQKVLATDTTTSSYIKHFRRRHPGFPLTEKDEIRLCRQHGLIRPGEATGKTTSQ